MTKTLAKQSQLTGLSPKVLRNLREKVIESILFLAAFSSIVTTVGIISILLYESASFFKEVSVWDFLTDTQWTPLFEEKHFGIITLVSGTLVTTFVALCVAIPLGTIAAIYLSEFAHVAVREIVKPTLELLAGVPTVVYGYFALLFVTPLLQQFLPDLPYSNMLSAGMVMGIMVIPYVSSLSEDAMRSVPDYLREASYATGATRFQTAVRVILPSAISGISAAYILGISRAIGETMVVAIAAGGQPNLTWNPMEPSQTMTAYIVSVSKGDIPYGSLEYQTIFAVGLTLLLMTLVFNIIGHFLTKRYREVY
ncbi:phosphate ABC transporter permease subunit PstC [Calothrix sp. UHCC 0171]|uniref:phosphate ABC transporter permease subunit PstC n=1 Tax=Calothrix sp. UHCC 0171 TaxID=3110245 RepID=UPI002B2106F3|nr:phosphate ABC transporter permease subunit PstC [Calothrix sp. UHCC 0171]MEA5570169.1 phosphate ABC transporter permease subunit PstC [Calothrix sp. UHCC 0171]